MKRALLLTALASTLLSVLFAQAQEAKPLPWHPGQTIKLAVTFTGSDASKINRLYPALNLVGTVPTGQVGFSDNFPGECKLTSAAAFQCDFAIPPSAATGDYKLTTVDARSELGRVVYDSGKDFQLHTFHIENPQTFTPPKITIKELP